ncbi:putative Ig domain-containing protein [Limimaricola pyoseonensis]|uniref:putative Ig domain-containing protein n=1 Tax=Limimaricola pyoseonensis TaxID=521013 RepID=UPI001A95E144|nr:putative Ig domain-containing protein [Limimaricola pyoseonensis]
MTDANDAPTIGGTIAGVTATTGEATSVSLAGLVLADEDAADTPVLSVRLADGSPLPDGITLNGSTLDVADSLPAGSYEIAVFANDGVADSAAPVTFTVTVSDATVLSLGAASGIEQGDDGVTTLLLPVSASVAAAAEVSVSYAINGGAPQTALLALGSDGTGSLAIEIGNDDLADGDSSVNVALIDTSSAGFAVNTTAVTATLTEDDFAPVAVDDTTSVQEGQSLTFDPAANDTDADSADLTVTAIDNASAGIVTLNGDGTVTVDATGVAAGQAITFDYTVADAGGNTAQGSASVDVSAFSPPTTIRVQAEDFDTANVFATQNQNAADGQVIYLTSGAAGSATYNLANWGIAAGLYNVQIALFDESDGESTLGFEISSTDVGGTSESFVLDDDATSGNAAQPSSFRMKTFADVEIGADGVMTLTGTRDAGEFGRIDYVEFTRTGDLGGGGTGDNGAPFVPFPPAQQVIDENAPYSLDVAGLFVDAEEEAFTVALANGDTLPAGLVLDAAGTLSGQPSEPGSYTVSFVATDVAGNVSAPQQVSFVVNDVNEAPESTGIANQSLTAGASAQFDAGAAFSDPDAGDVLTFSADTAVPGLDFDTTTGIFSGTPTAAGSYQVTVTATDGGGLSTSETFVFTVQPGGDGRESILIQAEDFQLTSGFFEESSNGITRIRLQGDSTGEAIYALDPTGASGSYDVRVRFFDENDGVSSATIWSVNDEIETELGSWIFDQDGGGSAAQLQNLRILTFPGLDVQPGTALKITGQSDTDEFVRIDYVELVPTGNAGGNFAPTVTNQIEDQTIAGLDVSIDLSSVFADPEEDALTYGVIVDPAAPGLSIVNGVLTGALPAGGTYTVTVTATDGPGASNVTVSDTFVITSTDTNEAPTLVSAPVEPIVVQEDGSLEEQIVFSDPDGVTYSLADGSPGWIEIDAEAGFLTGTPGNDDVGSVEVDVIATDGRGASTIETLTFTVENTNDAPELGVPLAGQAAVLGQAFSYALPAGAFTDVDAADVLTYSAQLADGSPLPGWLSIDPATGTLSGTPDSAADLSVVVTATDQAGASVAAPAIAVTVEQPVVSQDPIVIEAEDFTDIRSPYVVNTITKASGGEVIRLPGETTGTAATDLSAVPAGTYTLSVSFVDETDGISSAVAKIGDIVIGSWNFDGTAPKDAGPEAATGTFAQSGNFRTIPFDTVFTVGQGSVLSLEVTAKDGEFGRIDKVTLTPSAAPNAAPTITLQGAPGALAAETDTSQPVKIADIVIADDGVGTNALGLAGADAGLFEITGSELFLKAGTDLSALAGPLDVTVTVDDIAVGATPDDSVTLSIDVTAANAAPTLTGPAAVTVDENQTGVAAFTATDPDVGDTLSFTLGGTDGALFDIDAAGVLTFKQAPDFEAPGDADGDNVYDVTVSVGDGVNAPVSSDLAVTVADVAETALEQVVLRINAFGPEVAASDGGPAWQGDGLGAANSPYLSTTQDRGDSFGYAGAPGAIPADVPEAVLDTARSSDASFFYNIPVADIGGPGSYRVNFYIAELFAGAQAGNFRSFDASVEGTVPVQLDNIDPGAQFGPDVGILSAEVVVTDGELNIGILKDLIEGQQNPIVNAIEVVKLAGGVTDTTAPAATVALTQPADANGPLLVAVTLTDDSGIDAATLGSEDLQLSIGGTDTSAAITFTGFANGVASYEVAAPAGGWTDGAQIGITLKPGEVSDGAGNVNAAATASATLNIGGGSDEVLLRINAFGPEVAASDGGPVWQGDGLGAANSPYLSTTQDRGDTFGYAGDPGAIPADVPEAVMDTARSSDFPFSYDIPVAALDGNGNYTVRLYLAELFTGNQVPGERIFDVAIEGQILGDLDNIDPAALGDGTDATVISYNVTVDDGELNIDFLQDISDNPIVNAIEIAKYSGEVPDPNGGGGDPDEAIEILQGLSGIDSGATYGSNQTGAATLEIMKGSNSVQASNFGGGSFQLTNTGDKQIAAVVIDFRDAIYGDSVIDYDGTAGDTSAKEFALQSGASATGAITEPVGGQGDGLSLADSYLFPGAEPVPGGNGATGGFRGLLLRFDGSSGGFSNGESIGFAGDMDPNSLAAIAKSAVDSGAVNSWDVGGVSGAELIGSSFTVLFDDGTTATGYLGSDGSQAGSVGTATQAAAPQTASVTVNGASGAGIYGGTTPEIVVTGPANATVLVTMSKGLNPVTNSSGGVADLVEARLDNAHPAFPVSNAADFQTFEVTLDGSGTATLPGNAFDYNNAGGGQNFSGTAYTEGFATAPMVIAASVVNGAGEPLGPVDRVYLTSNGVPVSGGGGGTGAEGHYQGIGTPGGNYRFKVQIEDQNANGGTDPGGKWSFVDAPDAQGRQSGFQGDGYYLFGSNTSTQLNGVNANEVLKYTIEVPEGATGIYNFRFRVSRDGEAASDQQNDIWLNFGKAGSGESIEAYLTEPSDVAEPTSQGHVKVFGGPNNGSWGNASSVDGDPGNFAAQVAITEPGLYTVSIAGRSQGYHIDFWELYKGTAPGVNATNSQFVATGDTVPGVVDPIDDLSILVGAGATISTDGTFVDLDGDPLTITASIPQAAQGFVSFADGIFTVSNAQIGSYTLTVSAEDDDGNIATDSFELNVTQEPVGPELNVSVVSGGITVDADLQTGDSYALTDFAGTVVFSGEFTSGTAASVDLVLLKDGQVVGSQVENVTPFDLSIATSGLSAGDYTLVAESYSGTGGTGALLGSQSFGFSVTGEGGGTSGDISSTLISASSDYETRANVGLSGSDDYEWQAATDFVAMRFAGLGLNDAPVASATITLTAKGNGAIPNLDVLIENTANPAAFTNSRSAVENRSYTDFGDSFVFTPGTVSNGSKVQLDVTDLVNAFLAQAGDQSTDSLVFQLDALAASNAAAGFWAAADEGKSNAGLAPTLNITYDDPLI